MGGSPKVVALGNRPMPLFGFGSNRLGSSTKQRGGRGSIARFLNLYSFAGITTDVGFSLSGWRLGLPCFKRAFNNVQQGKTGSETQAIPQGSK